MNVIKNKISKEKVIMGVLLAAAIVLYNLVWLNRTFIMAECWAENYIGLLEQGKIPYKDFYYYMPPFPLLVDYVIWKLSFGYIIIYRIWRLLERVLIMELLYFFCAKRIKPLMAFISCFMAVVLYCATVHDACGDYNQTGLFLYIAMLILLSRYVDSIDNLSKRRMWAFWIGICGGIMFISKQNIVISSLIVFGLLLLLFAFLGIEKNVIQIAGCIALGAFIPSSITFLYLWQNQAWQAFINQMIMGSGAKGSIFYVLVEKFFKTFHDQFAILGIICAGLVYILPATTKWKIKKLPHLSEDDIYRCQMILIGATALFWGFSYGSFFVTSLHNILESGLVILFAVQVICILIVRNEKIATVSFLFTIGLAYIVLLLNPNDVTTYFYYKTSLFVFMKTLVNLVFIFLLIWSIYHIARCKIEKIPFDLQAIVFVFTSIAFGYALIMSNGEDGVIIHEAAVAVPAMTYVLFRDRKSGMGLPIKVLQIATVIVFGACLSQKLVVPYFWWGDTEASYWDKTERVEGIKALKGFRFSETEKKKWEGLNKIIDYYTDEHSTILGFPYVKAYNVFLDNYNESGFVPVLFYDVCPDEYAVEEAKILSKNEPDIVIWLDIPNCMEVYEDRFREGRKLGQRQIQKWFSEAKKKDYILVGQVDNVFVYKLKGSMDEPVTYTYIDRPTAKNVTAKYQKTVKVKGLDGKGTMKKPYLISSEEDLKCFRDLVNDGCDFRDKYVRQTADIDLSRYHHWRPIGSVNDGKAFRGNYNGDGYRISNMTIEKKKGKVGLFGLLEGVVENVILEDCQIEGKCSGGIASQGNGATIVNCVVTGNIRGDHRAGGIADNINGAIVNCVSDVRLSGDWTGGISGYYTNYVQNCFSNMGNDVSTDAGYKYTDASVDELNKHIRKLKKESYGKLLNKWEVKNGKLQLVHKF